MLTIVIMVINVAHSCTIDTIYRYQLVGSTYTKTPVDRTIYQRTIDKKPLIIIYQGWNTSTNAYINVKKDEFTYDNKFPNMTSEIKYSNYDVSNNIWVNNSLNQTKYNNLGLVTQNEFFNWDAANNNWKLYSEYQYTYTNHLLINEINRVYNASLGMVVNSIKKEMSYDANNNLIEKIISNWSIPINNWQLSYQYLYTYSGTNKKITEELLNYSPGTGWTGQYKNYYDYNSFDKLIESINQNYNSGSSSYINSSKIQYVYNSFNEIKSIYNFTWFEPYGIWDSTIWSENNYNAKGQLDTVYSYLYNSGSDLWDKYGKTYYKYTNKGKLTETHIQDWLESTGNFRTKKYEYKSYNNNDSLIWDQVFQYNFDLERLAEYSLITYEYNNSNPILIKEVFTEYAANTSVYLSAFRYEYVCTESTTKTLSSNLLNSTFIYPNPSSNGLIETNSESTIANIFNCYGQKIKTIQYQKGDKINLMDLENGLFLLQLDNNFYKIILNK